MIALKDESEIWWETILEQHYEEALARANSLCEDTVLKSNGCRETSTQTVRRVRFRGRQLPAYRFIYCVVAKTPAAADEVVRHRCHNRLCINPDHLLLGSRADNKHDDWDYMANGIDRRLL
ncbi:MAG: HNH endonuclease [Rhodobacteraceae bacterium HLUCCA12]|nr:MAG: HNH endonuclease [Rhodobacteraceae bacterium HLUCCA12]